MKWLKFKTKRRKPLQAKNIDFSYGAKEVLSNFNFQITNSQIVAIVGRSGEGKSTFLHLVAGTLTKKFGGRICISGFSRNFSKEDIGFVPQEISLIQDISIKDNIIFFGSLNGLSKTKSLSSAQELLNILQLDKISLNRFPSELSGGQKVRLNIVVSLLHKPKLYILDEPFVGLDFKNRKLLWHFLEQEKRRHKTIMLTTHMLSEAQLHCDRIVLLHKGKVYTQGKFEDIKKKLKTHFILELEFPYLSKTNQQHIENYCKEHEITILDLFGRHMMLSVINPGQKAYLIKFIQKLNVDCYEVGFREPSLDELFLKVDTI
ncbi:ABC transporter ATP-binding protein [Candidatus Woesearchaeota archaeon]|nr:ABC transporter ATP-binding protein [Candidatus Woesearchaeota archaeon]